MILYEFEGKQLLAQSGVAVPKSQLLSSASESLALQPPMVLKAQVLSGKRAAAGGIVKIDNGQLKIDNLLIEMFGKTINGEKVEQVLVEEMVEYDKEYYLSISYDTDSRSPVFNISSQGGTGIEDRAVKTFPINLLDLDKSLAEVKTDVPAELLKKLVQLFLDQDCTLVEINPLVKTSQNQWLALDAKIKLEDVAAIRHPDWGFPARGVPGYSPTQNELEAKKIDQDDYRGTAGSAYFDIEGGDIAILSSGGGISLTAMDSLISDGGKPANFTEYSGNPPKEKVVKLTKVVLNKANIHGLWVVGTVAANFTDIYETLSGLMEGLRQAQSELGSKFDFPIVIRRGGPREEEAYEMLRQVKDFNLTLQGEEVSVAQSAKIMADKALQYATQSER